MSIRKLLEFYCHRGSWRYTGGSDQDHPQEKEIQKGKMVVWGGVTSSCEREVKGKGEKESNTHLMQSSTEEQGEIRKPSSVISANK